VDDILRRAQTAMPRRGKTRQLASKALAYFENNRDKMRYWEYQAQGLFIGSGVVEAGCKTAVQHLGCRDRLLGCPRVGLNPPTRSAAGYYKLDPANAYNNCASAPAEGTSPATPVGSGSIDFEEADQAGEQSIFDSHKNGGAEAIAPLPGAFTWRQTLLSRSVPGIPFELRLCYNSTIPKAPPADGSRDPYERRTLGPGWRHTFDAWLFIENDRTEARLYTWDGGIETWTRPDDEQPFVTVHKEYRGEVIYDPTPTNKVAEWTTPERLVYCFESPASTSPTNRMAGRLIEIRDFNGNSIHLQWSDQAYLTNVVDSAGDNYRFHYDDRNLLTKITFDSWQVDFTYDTTNRLVAKSIANTSGLYTNVNTTWQFSYHGTNGLLDHVVGPQGYRNIFVQYDKYRRKTNQADALDRATATLYGTPGRRQITRVDPLGREWIEEYDRKGHIVAQTDPLGNTARHTYDPSSGNRTSTTDANTNTTWFAYDARANLIARTNALGEVTRWVFHTNSIPGLPHFNKPVQEVTPQPLDANGWTTWTNFYDIDDHTGNLLRHYDALGDLARHTYTPKGLVETSIDASGNTNRFDYDDNGFLIARTDPAGNTTWFSYNELGWKLAETNALGNVTT